jgi:uncharacterized membrane protein
LPPHVEETVRSIGQLHADHEKRMTFFERIVEHITDLLGRPGFMALLTVLVVTWIGGNLAAARLYHAAWDAPPFPWLQGGLQVLAIYMAAMILNTQRRADELADLREQVTLEVSILTEKKAAKLIELVEELRRDSPYLRDRVDHEAREMATRADPDAIIGAIEQNNQDIKAAAGKVK